MPCLQRTHNISIGRSRHSAVIVAEIYARNRQANIVDHALQVPWGNFTANGVLDLINQPGVFFDAGAGAAAHVQAECSRVHRREEVLPQERNQKSGGNTKTEEQHHEYNAVSQDEPEQIPITLPKPIEGPLELMLERDEGTEQAA